MHITLLYNVSQYNDSQKFDFITTLNNNFGLNLTIDFVGCQNLDNKTLKQFMSDKPSIPLLFFDKDSLVWATLCNNELIKVNADWQSYQSRIVKAGQKNEMLLKIAKLKDKMRVIDGTAGFGIDALILASTGASVTLIEQNPILFLILKVEQHKMSQHKNWQKLMGRIDIIYGDSGKILHTLDKVDLIYLDPMFPSDSYKGLVNKHMQVLHQYINPPHFDDEVALFETAIAHCDKLVIKRPISAPNFANINPMQSVSNDIVRFDKYSFIKNR